MPQFKGLQNVNNFNIDKKFIGFLIYKNFKTLPNEINNFSSFKI